MVKKFKVMHKTVATYPVDRETVEKTLLRKWPWYRENESKDYRYFAVCPKCENPVQLVNVTETANTDHVAYGRHVNGRLAGFAFFDGEELRQCPFKTENRTPQKANRKPLSEVSRQIIKIAIEDFDRVIHVLRQDLGIWVSSHNKCVAAMLRAWLGVQGYCYVGANLENIPWMIGYFSPTMNLFGLDISRNSDLVRAIHRYNPRIPIIDGRLSKGSEYYSLGLSMLGHHYKPSGDHDLLESLSIEVHDFTKAAFPGDAPVVFRQRLVVDPARFEYLRNVPPQHAHRDFKLLEMARQIAEEFNVQINP